MWSRRSRQGAVVLAALLVLVGGFAGEGEESGASPGDVRAGDCGLLPESSYWYATVTSLPVHRRSARILASIDPDARVKADFGSGRYQGAPIGIPYDIVPGDQPRVAITFDYAEESDGRRYPIPPDASIEGGPNGDGDRHVLLWQQDRCRLWEIFDARPQDDGTWEAGGGAIWNLRSNRFRPDGWTSADAAGLPILPGLVRYEEVAAGEITHAIRMTVPETRDTYVWPARHKASDLSDPDLPAMGQWLRLSDDIDPMDFDPQARVIVRALQEHGAVIADNGSALFISGTPDSRWDNDDLRSLGSLSTADFEVIRAERMMTDPDSGKVKVRFRPG